MTSILLVVMLAAIVNGQQERPTIEGAVRNVTVSEFKDATFSCNIRTVPSLNSEVKWIKISSINPLLISVGNFTTQTAGQRYNVKFVSNNNRVTSLLTIRNATRRDAARYRCILRTQEVPYTEWPQRDGFLFINVLPRVYGDIGTISTLENRTARIDCKVQDMTASQSVVQWVKMNNDAPLILSVGNNMMVTTGKYRTFLTTNGDMSISTLLVQNVTRNDAGVYRCIVQTRGINFRDWSQSDGFLKVKGWPTIQGEITNQTAEEYDDGRLYCNVKDLTPNSKVRWAKIDKGASILISVGDDLRKNLVEKYRVDLTTSNDWSVSSLTITSVTKKDAGRFRCIVETLGQPYQEWPKKDGFLIVTGGRRWYGNERNNSKDNKINCVVMIILLMFSIII